MTNDKRFTLIGFAAFLAAIALAIVGLPERGPVEKLRDPAVKSLYVDCGQAGDPPGTDMPAWRDGRQRHYTRQQWTGDGVLKVQVWEFLAPGHVLVAAEREVDGRRITVRPRWEVPPGGPVAACQAKLGVEIDFGRLPRADYSVDVR